MTSSQSFFTFDFTSRVFPRITSMRIEDHREIDVARTQYSFAAVKRVTAVVFEAPHGKKIITAHAGSVLIAHVAAVGATLDTQASADINLPTSRTSLNQTCTMGPNQFAYLAILAAVAGVIAVPIDYTRNNLKFCNPSFIPCLYPPVLVDGCLTCKFDPGVTRLFDKECFYVVS
ncbi:hypothetical protein P692DRAFT_201808103 [Suillus brevipes Sb2]|nr:hypothetical protein P692DRAFT_201808103 [Suillus brevipes Sb2]